MAGLDDALDRQRALVRSADSLRVAQTDQLKWARAEAVSLADRFVEGLSQAGHMPLSLVSLKMTRSDKQVRVGGRFSRRFRMEHEWSSTSSSAGQGWPVLVEGWADQTPDVFDAEGHPIGYGESVAAGIVFRPDIAGFSSVVFLDISRRRDGDELSTYGSGRNKPEFATLLTQQAATLRLMQLRGQQCGCGVCDSAVPLWRVGQDGAQLPIGPGPAEEQDVQGRWQRMYPVVPVIADQTHRYDMMLGRAIRALDENLRNAGAHWP